MTRHRQALRDAFPHTIPVVTAFIFLGAAYGILMRVHGYGLGWTLAFSGLAYGGSGQYLALAFLSAGYEPLTAFLMFLMVNARHLFYGIGMLEAFQGTGKYKPFLIFSLCDETFSLLAHAKPSPGVDRTLFMFYIALINYLAWQAGSVLGSLVGTLINFNVQGLDFVLTALFMVIFLGQWESAPDRRPALIGLGSSLAALLVFGPQTFIIPAMVLIVLGLGLLKNKTDREEAV